MNQPIEIPNSERLQAIREADEAAGPDLQMAPRAWLDRRDLLKYATHLERLVIQREAEIAALQTQLAPTYTIDVGTLTQEQRATPQVTVTLPYGGAIVENMVQTSAAKVMDGTCPHGYKLADLLTRASVCAAGCTVEE